MGKFMADDPPVAIDPRTSLGVSRVCGRYLADGEWYEAGAYDVEVEIPVHESRGVSYAAGKVFLRPLRVEDFTLEKMESSPPYVVLENGRVYDRDATEDRASGLDFVGSNKFKIAYLSVDVSSLSGPLKRPLLRDIKLVDERVCELRSQIGGVADAVPNAVALLKGFSDAMASWQNCEPAIDLINLAIARGEAEVQQRYLLPMWSELAEAGRRLGLAREAYRRSGGDESDFSTRWYFRQAERRLAGAHRRLTGRSGR